MGYRQLVKTWRRNGVTLKLWDINERDGYGKHKLEYELKYEKRVIFAGKDFACSPMDAIDSIAAVRSLLGFLTLRPGDTDAEYFANYTTEQFAFADSDQCEDLRMYLAQYDQ